MSKLMNILECDNCGEELSIVLEYLNKDRAIKEIQECKCWKCGSEKWHFTDIAEH